ncbi:MAG TPA: TIGR02206 family membrane protein [Pedococcus sp.]|nr:TIGR02206 family membrane protein [Pedococcus sp.]
MSTPLAYWTAVAVGAVIALGLCFACRRRPGGWVPWAGRAIAVTLAVDALVFLGTPVVQGGWSMRTSLPLALCDVALLVAAVVCWWPGWLLGVELTYFWGLAGTVQAVITPDLSAGFPQLVFFQFVVGHIGIVVAALYLVVGLQIEPRRGAVYRVFGLTTAYAVVLGLFDWGTGSNYMYLAAPPQRATLLSLLGPWPWYLLSATVVALVLLVLLDLPFRRAWRRR